MIKTSVKQFKAEHPIVYRVLSKMCEFAKLPVKVLEELYAFEQFTWTSTQENKFKEWLENELRNDSKLRRMFMKFPQNTKTAIKKVVSEFNLNYGFRTKEE